MSENNTLLISEILSHDDSEFLNRRVCGEIHPTLFLFNDYRPDEQPVFHEKDRFRTNVDNLYRLTFDAGFVLRFLLSIARNAQGNGGSLVENAKKIDQIVRNIKTVRTVHAHNMGGGHQFFNQRATHNYKSMTANYDLSKENGYADFNHLLVRWADKLKKTLSSFIDEAARISETDKKALIDSWQNFILTYYSQLHNNVYYGVMASVFYGRCSSALQKEISEANVKSLIGDWIYSYFGLAKTKSQGLEQQIDELDQKLKTGSVSTKFCEIAQTERAKAVNEKDNIERWLPDEEWKGNSNDIKQEANDLYKSQVESRLRDMLVRNPLCSMLPEKLIKKQIEETFKSVPVPDYIR